MAKNDEKDLVSPEEFIEIWQTSKNVDEIVKRTKMNRQAVYQRAYIYRQEGIPLKKFRRGRKRKDVDKLKELAKELKPESENGSLYG